MGVFIKCKELNLYTKIIILEFLYFKNLHVNFIYIQLYLG